MSDAEMRNASPKESSRSKRIINSANSKYGQSKRHKPNGKRRKNYEKGGPSQQAFHGLGIKSLHSHSKVNTNSKGKSVFLIDKPSFKKTKKKTGRLPLYNDDVTSLPSTTRMLAANFPRPAGFYPSSNPPLKLKSHLDQMNPLNPISNENNSLSVSFILSDENFINTNYPSLSLFKPLPNHSSPREFAAVKMEFNNSSPHSSNSITQSPLLPLSPSNPQKYDNITSLLAPHVVIEENMGNPHVLAYNDHVENDKLRTSWENLLGPSSVS